MLDTGHPLLGGLSPLISCGSFVLAQSLGATFALLLPACVSLGDSCEVFGTLLPKLVTTWTKVFHSSSVSEWILLLLVVHETWTPCISNNTLHFIGVDHTLDIGVTQAGLLQCEVRLAQ